jgi:hypothetical protein
MNWHGELAAAVQQALDKHNAPVKLCKDCGWLNYALRKQAVCIEPGNVDLVTGDIIGWDAHDMRNDKLGGRCGRDARLFKPKS